MLWLSIMGTRIKHGISMPWHLNRMKGIRDRCLG